MDLKMKPTNEMLLKILRKEFMKDLKAAKLCASDTLNWVLKSEESTEDYFHKWLINEGYADFVKRKHKYYHCKECGFTFLLADNASLNDIEIFKSLAIFHKNPKLDIPCRRDLTEISEKKFLIIRNGEDLNR